MSILKAMYAGVSGLQAQGQALGIVGDNIANANTIGFKQSRAVFQDVLGGAVGQRGTVGGGVRMSGAQQIFAQGNLLTTGQPTDLALSGDGFFVVNGNINGVNGNFYSRNGQFVIAQDGSVMNQQGLTLQGFPPGGGPIGDITVPTASLSPKATTGMGVTANLDANATPPTLPWDAQDPVATSNFSTSMTMYDSLGNAHTTDVYFRNTGAGQWEYHAVVDGGEVAGGTAGTNAEIATGTLDFDTTGALQDVQLTGGGTVDFVGATPGQAVAFDFGNPISAGGTGLGGSTGFGSPSAVSSQTQDGYSSGDLTGITISSDGIVSGVYSNGEQVALAEVAVAKFNSNDGLGKSGQNTWMQTRDSGKPVIGTAGTGGRAAMVAGALEQSNVDIAAQFVDLITHQRSFQANSRTITTADEMMQEVVNLKR